MTVRPGLRNALSDVPGISVGHAHDRSARTGTSVLRFESPMRCAVDVRGGGPATRETDAVGPLATLGIAHALVFSGGSIFGLGAADRVAALLSESGIGLKVAENAPPVPIVPSACLFDLANGGDKAWGAVPPYAVLAEQAFSGGDDTRRVGSVGAGFGASAGRYRGGLGQASLMLEGGMTVAALIAVNSIGSPLMPDGRTPWAWPFERDQEFGGRRPDYDQMLAAPNLPADAKSSVREGEATCIGAVAVSAPLDRSSLHRIAIMAQDGLARAVRPSHARFDGDTLFALCPTDGPEVSAEQQIHLGSAAADCIARAIGRAVWNADDDLEDLPTIRGGMRDVGV